MGTRLDTFVTFAKSVDAKRLNDPVNFLNDATTQRTYTFFRYFKRKKSLQGGNGIQYWREFDIADTAEFVASNHKFDPQGTDGMYKSTLHWGRLANYMVWEDDEIEENEAAQREKYFDLYKSKRVRMATGTVEKLEAALWAAPDDNMEIAISATSPSIDTPRLPYSIPSLVTTATDGNAFPTATTVQGLSPSTHAKWDNQRFTFANFENEIEDRLMDAYYQTRWEKPGSPVDGMFSGTEDSGCEIFTQYAALQKVRRILRDSNDRLTSLGQYDKEISYLGKPILRAEALDGGSTSTVDSDIVMYGINSNYLYPIIRKNYFMKLKGSKEMPYQPFNMPMSNVIYEFTEYNLVCESRRRQFTISYSAS